MPVFPPNYLRDQWFESNDPTLDPKLRDWLVSIADKPDGGYVLANELPSRYDPREIITAGNGTPQAHGK